MITIITTIMFCQSGNVHFLFPLFLCSLLFHVLMTGRICSLHLSQAEPPRARWGQVPMNNQWPPGQLAIIIISFTGSVVLISMACRRAKQTLQEEMSDEYSTCIETERL